MEEKRIEELQKRYLFTIAIRDDEKGLMPSFHASELKKNTKLISEIKENKQLIIAWIENRDKKRQQEKEKETEEKKKKDAEKVQTLKKQGKLIHYFLRSNGDYTYEAILGTGYHDPESAQNYKEEYRQDVLFGNSATEYHNLKHIQEEDIKTTIRKFGIGMEDYYILPEEEYKRLIKKEKETEEQRLNEQKEKNQKEKERIDNIFKKAKISGKRQLLEKFVTECDNPKEECNTDIICKYAMPDGSTTTTINHTW